METPAVVASATPSLANHRRQNLLLTMCALFVGFFVAAELLGAKLWHFTFFGFAPRDLGLQVGADDRGGEWFIATAGTIAFPLTFILTDIINEYFGLRIVRVFTILAIAVNILIQPIVLAAIAVPAHSFADATIVDERMQTAFATALGQSWAIVAGSLVAFLIGQFLDISVFSWLRRKTRGKYLWLRAQASTLVSQLVDSFIVIFLAFVIIPGLVGGDLFSMEPGQAAVVSTTNYVFKFIIAIAITPLLYLTHWLIDTWLGKSDAQAMVHEAHPADPV